MSNLYNISLVNNLISEFQKGNKKESFSSLKNYIKNNPTDHKAIYNFGLMADQLGKKDVAIRKR